MRKLLALAALVAVTPALADTCMVSPTEKQTVSGRFGKFRGGGSGNFGSANQKPHMHDGLDFSTSGASQPLYATTDGKITFIGNRRSAGNAILIERSNGDVVAYYHMSGFATGLKQGMEVKAGQQLGLSGNTPSDAMVKHLHFTYGTAQKDEARAKAFTQSASKGTFNPSQLPSAFNQQQGIGWKTDPAPYFCATFPIQDGNPQHYPILGKDTKEQHAILFGSVLRAAWPRTSSSSQHKSRRRMRTRRWPLPRASLPPSGCLTRMATARCRPRRLAVTTRCPLTKCY